MNTTKAIQESRESVINVRRNIIKNGMRKILQDEIAGEVWYESKNNEERLQRLLCNAENELVTYFTTSQKDIFSALIEDLEGLRKKIPNRKDRELETYLFGRCLSCVEIKGNNKAITKAQDIIRKAMEV